jgi:hypothetical protein
LIENFIKHGVLILVFIRKPVWRAWLVGRPVKQPLTNIFGIEPCIAKARGASKRLAAPNGITTTLAKDEIIYQWRNSSLYRHLSSTESDAL